MSKIITQISRRVFTGSILLLLVGYHAGQAQERGLQDTVKNLPLSEQDQPVNLLYRMSKPKKYITGSVSSISGSEITNIPGTNRLNTMAGRLAGLTVVQDDALPGAELSAILVRGYHTFTSTGNSTPMILINGRVDDVTMIEPNDIESITILKDAAATALYGLNSANGLILVTTKRGKEGKININYNVESSFQQPTRIPKFLDSYNYALLYNEAQLNDNPAGTVKYNLAALDAYKTGSDPYVYPNVDWTDRILKDFSLQTRNNLNLSGGTDIAKYYFSGSYLTDNGIFDVNKSINTYNTNSNINVFNVRANVDLKIAKNLSLFTDIRSKREKRNQPGAYNANYDETIFGALYGTPANAYPVTNANGSLGGNSTYTNNPYGLLNYSGYSNYIIASVSSFSELAYDFNSLVKGLKLRGSFGFTSYTEFNVNRTKNFEVYQFNPVTSAYTRIGANTTMSTAGSDYRFRNRIFDHSLTLDYAADFNDHSFSSMLIYERQQFDDGITGSPRLTRNFQGPKASLSYRFKNKYLIDFVAAYQGNEQYPKGNRYGFFPAVSAGWIISDESFMKGHISDFVDFLKIRGSYGKTGNKASNVNFSYLGSYTQGGAGVGGAAFGITPANTQGIYQSQIANPLVTWEKSLKSNAGIDISLANNKLNASFDYFNEETKDILISDAIISMYGAPIQTPGGSFKNKGFEIQAGWADRIRDFQYSVTASYSVAKNEITNMGEQVREYPWMYVTGNPLGVRQGYVFDRFFTEADDISTLPSQLLLGRQRSGDLKYNDLNNDGVINDNDISIISNGKIPHSNFGVNLGGRYKGLDLNVFFHGTKGGTTYNSGLTYNEFSNSGRGNVLEHHLNRWTPGSGQSAQYPRLTLTNTNNFVPSSYWVKDNSFVRLKYLELGYTLPSNLVNKIGISGTRVFVNGNNVFLWDEVKYKDPEAQDNAVGYPLQRSFSVGLNVKF